MQKILLLNNEVGKAEIHEQVFNGIEHFRNESSDKPTYRDLYKIVDSMNQTK